MSFHLAKKQLDFMRLETKLSIRAGAKLVTGYSPNTQSCVIKAISKFRHQIYKRIYI